MASTDARPVPRKNVAYRVTFPLMDADGDLVTGAAGLDEEVSKDGGTFADTTNAATEIATASGIYYIDLTSTEMNADTVAIIVKATGVKTTTIVMYPEEQGDYRIDETNLATAANLATVAGYLDTEIAAIKAKTDSLTFTTANRVDSQLFGVQAGAINAAAIADGAIDNATFAADTGQQAIRSATAQAGAAGSITLDASASAVTDFYVNTWVYVVGGTGIGQVRRVTGYNGTSKVASTAPSWATTPDNTSVFAILPFGMVRADVARWNGTDVATPAVAGVPSVEVIDVSAAGSADILAGLLDGAASIETGLTMRQALRGIASALFGKLAKSGTTWTFRNAAADSADRITATVDATGRPTITLNL